jgi:hypothetical protein
MRSAVPRKALWGLILLLAGPPVQGQFLDTLRASFHTRPRFLFQLDTYNSFVSREPANTFGLRAGLDFNKRVRLSVGYYTLTSDIVKSKTITGVFADDTTLNARLDMNYFPLTFEYVFYNRYPWEFSVPLSVGAGKSYFWYYKNKEGDKEQIDQKTVALALLSVGAQYKILPWFGVGAGLGYRVMLVDNSNINENFNSVIYSLNLRIFLDEVIKSVFGKRPEGP